MESLDLNNNGAANRRRAHFVDQTDPDFPRSDSGDSSDSDGGGEMSSPHMNETDRSITVSPGINEDHVHEDHADEDIVNHAPTPSVELSYADLQQDNEDLQQENEDLHDDIIGIGARIGELEDEIQDLHVELENLKREKQELGKDKSLLRKKLNRQQAREKSRIEKRLALMERRDGFVVNKFGKGFALKKTSSLLAMQRDEKMLKLEKESAELRGEVQVLRRRDGTLRVWEKRAWRGFYVVVGGIWLGSLLAPLVVFALLLCGIIE